eukprot:gnl/TRDRNA2_/TRDRNA2_159003_c7_seq1.p1 gnl/TRDRNA2_/TRDRNA2_159003_c7~~gnl/TRDRNA2_/TRDRNA2_159003_c7_seq1.p1  ORF type:complete len:581 (-),score=79.90 gnl/TRDRNA2_/TRDRNA2_159003_c7_seq1:23-1744(-)
MAGVGRGGGRPPELPSYDSQMPRHSKRSSAGVHNALDCSEVGPMWPAIDDLQNLESPLDDVRSFVNCSGMTLSSRGTLGGGAGRRTIDQLRPHGQPAGFFYVDMVPKGQQVPARQPLKPARPDEREKAGGGTVQLPSAAGVPPRSAGGGQRRDHAGAAVVPNPMHPQQQLQQQQQKHQSARFGWMTTDEDAPTLEGVPGLSISTVSGGAVGSTAKPQVASMRSGRHAAEAPGKVAHSGSDVRPGSRTAEHVESVPRGRQERPRRAADGSSSHPRGLATSPSNSASGSRSGSCDSREEACQANTAVKSRSGHAADTERDRGRDRGHGRTGDRPPPEESRRLPATARSSTPHEESRRLPATARSSTPQAAEASQPPPEEARRLIPMTARSSTPQAAEASQDESKRLPPTAKASNRIRSAPVVDLIIPSAKGQRQASESDRPTSSAGVQHRQSISSQIASGVVSRGATSARAAPSRISVTGNSTGAVPANTAGAGVASGGAEPPATRDSSKRTKEPPAAPPAKGTAQQLRSVPVAATPEPVLGVPRGVVRMSAPGRSLVTPGASRLNSSQPQRKYT